MSSVPSRFHLDGVIGRITFLPVAVGLLFFPSLAYTISFGDGSTDFFGAPLPWNSRSLTTSLSKDVYILPLVLDAALYVFVSYWIVRHLSQSSIVKHILPNWFLVVLIWAWGIASALWMMLVVFIQPVFHIWYTHPWVGVI